MADTKISALTELAAEPAADDEFVIVDKSDTTMAASGTDKRLRYDRLPFADKAPLASPALTGSPTAPTPADGDNDTSIATTKFVNNSRAAAPVPKLLAPALVAAMLPDTLSTSAANRLHVVRAIAPRDGNIDAIIVAIGTASGNAIPVIYDCGDASAGNYTVIASGGSQSIATANAWNVFTLTSALAVVPGQHLMIGFIIDNTTATVGRHQTANNAFSTLPTGVGAAPGGNANKYAALSALGSFATATVSEANMTSTNAVWSIAGRYA